MGLWVRTRLSNADSNVPSLERSALEGESLLQSIDGGKLDIAEPFGLMGQLVFDDADAGDLAACKDFSDIVLRSVER